MSLRQTVKYNQYRGHSLVTAPTVVPISVDELIAYLKLGDNDEGVQLSMMIDSVVAYCERYLGIAFITQTWRLTLDQFPTQGEPWWDGVRDAHINVLVNESRASEIFLPRHPLISVDSMTADSAAVVIADIFIVDTQQQKGRLVLKYGAVLPVVVNETANGVVIDYTAGFGATAALVPADLRLGLLQFAGYLYSNRGDGCSAESAFKKSGAKGVMDSYKVMDL